MDLRIKGRKAIVCASSRGLGKACATALAQEGCDVVINGRTAADVNATADEIRAASGAVVETVVADVSTESGRASLLKACEAPDILINNNGGPPPGAFEDWNHDDWVGALEANLLAPVFMIQGVLPGMRARKFGRIVNITSARVKTPTARMGLSTTARTGLTGMCKALSVEVAADNVTINNLLPERINTDRQKFMAGKMMESDGITEDEAYARIAASLPAKRLGTTEEFGAACAFLCSDLAGFISGQNLHLDGGSYRGIV